jgi:hypothetical protein
MPNKEMSNGEGQKKEVWYGHALGRRKVAFQPVFSIQTFTSGLNRKKN